MMLVSLLLSGLILAKEDSCLSPKIESLQTRLVTLPRYNLFISAAREAGMTDVKSVSNGKDSFSSLDWRVSATINYLAYELGDHWGSLGFYLGMEAGYSWKTFSTTDYLSNKDVSFRPEYIGLNPFVEGRLALGRISPVSFRLGYCYELLTSARFDGNNRLLVGFNKDCLNKNLHGISLEFLWPSPLWLWDDGRIQLRTGAKCIFTPILSANALEYYKGYQFEVDRTLWCFSIGVSILLGGTDR
jgi:hypothetical protein